MIKIGSWKQKSKSTLRTQNLDSIDSLKMIWTYRAITYYWRGDRTQKNSIKGHDDKKCQFIIAYCVSGLIKISFTRTIYIFISQINSNWCRDIVWYTTWHCLRIEPTAFRHTIRSTSFHSTVWSRKIVIWPHVQ